MAAKTFTIYLSELVEVSSLSAGDKVPVLESSTVKYVDGGDIGGGGGITALTGDVTASGSGSVAATIANLAVTNAKVATGIDAAKIADGTVSNAEFQYLGGVTSDIQTQLNAKQAGDADLTAIAGLTPSNDDFLQRKAGAWTNRTIAQVKTDLGVPTYARYVALLTQSDTDAPVATVLENTLGGTVVWSYDSAATYVGTLAGAFLVNKTVCFGLVDFNTGAGGGLTIGRIDDNSIGVFLSDGDNKVFNIEIRVYP